MSTLRTGATSSALHSSPLGREVVKRELQLGLNEIGMGGEKEGVGRDWRIQQQFFKKRPVTCRFRK